MSDLPHLADDAALDRWMADGAAVARALVAAARIAGLSGEPVRYPAGSVPVGAVGDVVLKLFPDVDRSHARTEAACLAALDGALPIPTPGLLDQHEPPGWRILVMRRLPGEPLVRRWGALDEPARAVIGRQVGEAAATLHGIAAPPEVPRVDWPRWVAERRDNLVDRQRARGAPEWLLECLLGFLDAEPPAIGPRGSGWLHTELMQEHLLAVDDGSGGVRLSGLVDFEPSFVAPVDYEWSSLGLFVARGSRATWEAILDGLGVTPTPEVARRAFAMALMHRYANLAWYLRTLPPAEPTLEATIEAWFPITERARR